MLVRKRRFVTVPVLKELTTLEVKQVIRDEVSSRSAMIGLIKTWVGREEVVTGGVILNHVHLQAIVRSAPMRQTFSLKVGGKIRTLGDYVVDISFNLYPAPILYVANASGLLAILFAALFLIYWNTLILMIVAVFTTMTVAIYAAGLLVESYSAQELQILTNWVDKLRHKFGES